MNIVNLIKNKINQIINWLRLKIYFLKVDFTKMSNRKAKIISIITKVICIIILLFLIVASFIPFYFLNSFRNLVENMSEQKKNQIENLAVTIYGLQLTVYSIMVSTKHKLIFGVSEYKMKMKISKSGHNIEFFLIMSNAYLVIFIISKILNVGSASSSVSLLLYSVITLIKNVLMINTNSAKIYYLYRCENLITNPLIRKNGNIKSICTEKIIDLNFKIVLEKAQDNNFMKIYNYLSILEEMNFYGLNNEIYDEKELFKIYLSTYFKQINNDSKILCLNFIFDKINSIILTLCKNENFYIAIGLLEISIVEFNRFLKTKFLRKRLSSFKKGKEYISEKDIKKLVELYIRNLFLLNIIIDVNKNISTLINEMKIKYSNNIFHENISKIEGLSNENKSLTEKFNEEING